MEFYSELEGRKAKQACENPDMSDLLAVINKKARDNARTPTPVGNTPLWAKARLSGAVQWDATEKAGFTTGKPWMRVNEDNRECNVQDQQGRPGSIWTFWRDTLRLRKGNPVLVSCRPGSRHRG